MKSMKRMMAMLLTFALVLTSVSLAPLYENVEAASQMQVKVAKKLTLETGQKKKLKVKVTPKKTAKKISFKSSDKTVVKVSKKGVLTAKKAGTATIRVKVKAKGKSCVKKCRVTVTAPAETTQPGSSGQTGQEGQTTQQEAEKFSASAARTALTAGDTEKITVKGAAGSVKYTSSDPYAATVSEDGTITALAQGSTVITVTCGQETEEISLTVDYDRSAVDKPRVCITNDGEIDDKNSYVHLLYYANEIDLVGLVQTSSFVHWAGSEDAPDESGKTASAWPGTEWQDEFIDDYAELYPNLRVHDNNYPTPNYLHSIVKVGNIGYEGDTAEETEGSQHIESLILDDVEGPLYITAWGGLNTVSRALLSIYEDYGTTDEWASVQQKIYDKVRLYIWGGQDDTYDEIVAKYYPELTVVDVSSANSLGWKWESANTNSYKHQIPEVMSGEWISENIDNSSNGSLIDNYITFGDGKYCNGDYAWIQFGTTLSGVSWLGNDTREKTRCDFMGEGDTPTYLPFFDTGLDSLENLGYGNFSGRFVKDEEKAAAGCTNYYVPENDWMDMGYGYASYESGVRWIDDIFNGFASRVEWGVTSDYEDANHRPDMTIKQGNEITASAGERVYLKAKTSDPDGDKVSVSWFNYVEAGTYRKEGAEENTEGSADTSAIAINGEDYAQMSFVVPEDAKSGDTIHMIAKATDSGKYNLTYYQRVVITVK